MAYKIIYASDLHGNISYYKKLIAKAQESEIKAIIIGGDLCPRRAGTLEEAVKHQKDFLEDFFIKELSKLKKDVFFIMGNDDYRVNEQILVKPIMTDSNKKISSIQANNLKYIHKKMFDISSKKIVGYGFVNPTPFRLKDWEKPEDNKKEVLKQMFEHEVRTIEKEAGTVKEDLMDIAKLSNPKNTVYAIHAPPYGTKLDITNNGSHVGSKAIREFIGREQPYLTLHGHIHESPKMSGSFVDKIGA